LVGFLLAFVPLYILGLMGATRRLDHYDPSLGWQPLFVVAGIGVAVIGLGLGFQILQLFVSVKNRKSNLDTTGDPWDGRTLEWLTKSPPPFYNYAVIPQVDQKDAFWAAKKAHQPVFVDKYQSLRIPKNTIVPAVIASFAFAFGFAMIWHIYWLGLASLLAIIACIIIRSTADEHEYTISASELRKLDEPAQEAYS
jgi:cytochrome o ubiquinol oxidase subunit 1